MNIIERIVAGILIAAVILGTWAGVALTLSNTSNNTRDMYEACIHAGHSPVDCRNSVNGWSSG